MLFIDKSLFLAGRANRLGAMPIVLNFHLTFKVPDMILEARNDFLLAAFVSLVLLNESILSFDDILKCVENLLSLVFDLLRRLSHL